MSGPTSETECADLVREVLDLNLTSMDGVLHVFSDADTATVRLGIRGRDGRLRQFRLIVAQTPGE